MKQSESEIITLLTAIKDGAEWEFETTTGAFDTGRNGFQQALGFLGASYLVRLKPKPVMVPLGPEDWEGIWWVKFKRQSMRLLVTGVGPNDIQGNSFSVTHYSLKENGHSRSRDGKNWEPCEKLQS